MQTNSTGEYGTSLKQLAEYFASNKDYKIVETSYKFDKTDETKKYGEAVTSSKTGNNIATFSNSSLYASENSEDTEKWVDDAKDSFFVKWITNYLKKGTPIMVEWSDWGGHWQVIIGYDTMGTPTIADDVLILADPYDTTDHSQDGYYTYPVERWFYMWNDFNVVQKPYQVQNFVVVEKANNSTVQKNK